MFSIYLSYFEYVEGEYDWRVSWKRKGQHDLRRLWWKKEENLPKYFNNMIFFNISLFC